MKLYRTFLWNIAMVALSSFFCEAISAQPSSCAMQHINENEYTKNQLLRHIQKNIGPLEGEGLYTLKKSEDNTVKLPERQWFFSYSLIGNEGYQLLVPPLLKWEFEKAISEENDLTKKLSAWKFCELKDPLFQKAWVFYDPSSKLGVILGMEKQE
jgi:hypothetical protein